MPLETCLMMSFFFHVPVSDIGEPIKTSTKVSFDANCSGVACGVVRHEHEKQ